MNTSVTQSHNLSSALATYSQITRATPNSKFLIIKAEGVDQYHVVEKLGVIAYLIASLVAMFGGAPVPYTKSDLDSANLAQSISDLNRTSIQVDPSVSDGMTILLGKIGNIKGTATPTKSDQSVESKPVATSSVDVKRVTSQHDVWVKGLKTVYGPMEDHNLTGEFTVQVGSDMESGTLPELVNEVLERGLNGDKIEAMKLRIAINELVASGRTMKPKTPTPQSPKTPPPPLEFGTAPLFPSFPSGIEVAVNG